MASPGWSLERAAEQAVADGYAGLEVRILDGQVIPTDLPAERRAAIRSLMKQHGLVIAGIGASTRFSSPDADDRAQHLADLRAYLALASDLEVPIVRHLRRRPVRGPDDAGGYRSGRRQPWRKRRRTPNGTASPSAWKTHDAFCRGQEVAGVLRQVDSSYVKAVWDVHHPFRMGESVEDTWNFIGARLAHVHMKDAQRREDESWELKLMGEGEVPCREIIHLLASKGYDGYLCAEWEKAWHPEIEEPEIALPQHARVLRQWMAEEVFSS